jgi:C4-dicarboxylate transporter, DctM subunit
MDLTLPVLLIIVLGCLIGLLAMRVPVAFSLLATGTLGLILLDGFGVAANAIARLPYSVASQYTYLVIPMFVAMGVFAQHSNVAEQLFLVSARLLKRVPGGLALAALAACAGFAAVSGSSVATVLSVGRLSITEMRRHGYSIELAAGVVGAAGTLGALIPPSIVLVIFGVLTGVSIGQLLIAGIVPGILSALIYGAAIIWRCHRHPELTRAEVPSELAAALAEGPGEQTEAAAPQADTDAGDDRTSDDAASGAVQAVGPGIAPPKGGGGLEGFIKIAVLVAIVVGGIYSGQFTVIESSAMAAFAALLILVYHLARHGKGRRVSVLRTSMVESVSLTSMVFLLLLGGSMLTAFMVSAGVPGTFTRWAVDLPVSPTLVIIVLLLAFIPLGMFLDPLSLMLVGVPLAYPVVSALGFDGVWFGILVVKCIEIGLITPPLGLNAYVVAGVSKEITVDRAFRGILWFLPLDIATTALIFTFPEIVLWLPRVFAG